jgi:hypothetical protein
MQKDSKTGRIVRDDLTGQTHANGSTAIRFHSITGNGGSKWVVKCVCGTEMVAWAESFKRGVLCRRCRNAAIAAHRVTHGKRYTVEYRIWAGMKNRCLNKDNDAYDRYGGKGIKVCQRWIDSFEAFFADMGPRPEWAWAIDRWPNPAGNYEPGNCRWATREESDNNKTISQVLTFNGKTQTWSQWGRELEIDKTTIRKRVLKGWPVERVLSKSDGRTSYTITHNGKTQTLMEWVKQTGVPKSTILNRMKRGLTGDDLFAT